MPACRVPTSLEGRTPDRRFLLPDPQCDQIFFRLNNWQFHPPFHGKRICGQAVLPQAETHPQPGGGGTALAVHTPPLRRSMGSGQQPLQRELEFEVAQQSDGDLIVGLVRSRKRLAWRRER